MRTNNQSNFFTPADTSDDELSHEDLESEIQLKYIRHRNPPIIAGRDTNFWLPYYEAYQTVDSWVKDVIKPANQEALEEWRFKAHQAINGSTLDWCRSNTGTLNELITNVLRELRTTFDQQFAALERVAQPRPTVSNF